MNPQHINELVREEVRATRAYQTPPADGLIKLDAMENPYSLPAELRDAWLTRLGAVAVNRYPDPQCKNLKAAIRDTFNIVDAHGLVLGNGSDELIQMLALLVGGRGRTILAPTPTFAMYELIAKVTGAEFIGAPLRDDFALDGDALLQSIAQTQTRVRFPRLPQQPDRQLFRRRSHHRSIKSRARNRGFRRSVFRVLPTKFFIAPCRIPGCIRVTHAIQKAA